MNSIDVLVETFGRVREHVHGTVEGLDEKALNLQVDAEANPIGWLVWHLTRVQDDHVAELAGTEQAYTADGWADRFGFDLPPSSIGYGHTPAQVAAVHVTDPALLTGYYDAVHDRTLAYLRTLADADLDEVIDDRWDPPVTRGVRLVSVADDDIQHAGQAAYVAGIARRGS
ncbi:mycothiol transferase [Actinomycetospora sp. TBRC 11914]|uniref:mycothiol transferase n=1 Tax=Actinomycetospora sp. TBRC 11914 TaxID=2729387 RepID=UPI00145FB8CE|nr:DinB family protein [Actinomycetospora sp. TBRC 11914]NMO90445.1 DinB family protein [Actinomycetospora sp. TBRC 11914]